MKQAVAVIPARGGSKGIPKKNIRRVGGRPLIDYSIQVAKKAKLIQRVIVSTDDTEIANVAERSGAEVVFRPSSISGDLASSESALLHTLEQLEKMDGKLPDVLAFLQCTSPFTTSDDIDGTVDLIVNGKADSAFAAVPFHYFVWSLDENGEAQGINHHKSNRPMRQEREPQFLEAGAVYAMDVQMFRKHKYRFFGRTAIFEIPESHCFEIDEPSDLGIAEAMIVSMQNT